MVRNHYIFDPKVVDLAKVRDQAYKQSIGEGWEARPEKAIIHHHSEKAPCQLGRENDTQKHEVFEAVNNA